MKEHNKLKFVCSISGSLVLSRPELERSLTDFLLPIFVLLRLLFPTEFKAKVAKIQKPRFNVLGKIGFTIPATEHD